MGSGTALRRIPIPANFKTRFVFLAHATHSVSRSPGILTLAYLKEPDDWDFGLAGKKGERRSVVPQAPPLLRQRKPYLTGSPPSRQERRYRPDVECPSIARERQTLSTPVASVPIAAVPPGRGLQTAGFSYPIPSLSTYEKIRPTDVAAPQSQTTPADSLPSAPALSPHPP